MVQLNEKLLLDLTTRYGNAFYLLDSTQFQTNYIELKREFEKIYPHFNIAYSYKTNYTPTFCKIVNTNGGYAEVVSEMELELALRIGVLPEKIIWNGPIKNTQKVHELLLAGGTVNIDSKYELPALVNLAAQNPDKVLNIGLRCNFDVGDGVVSRFGFDIDDCDFQVALSCIKNTPNLHLINLQCHFAKRNIEFWQARTTGMITVAKRVQNALGYLPDRLDVGGGMYGKMDSSLKAQFQNHIPSYAEYAAITATVFAEHFPDFAPELLIEPGSALVGDCMQFVGRVETLKNVRGKTFATILGSQKNISMSGVNPPIQVIGIGQNRAWYKDVDIVGYTCIENDVLFHGYQGELAVGDYICFFNCGSYSVVMKPPFILPNFPVIDISGKRVQLVKRQETFDDLFHTFSF